MRIKQPSSREVHVLASCAVALGASGTANADELLELSIPPQSLQTALLAFADQNDQDLKTKARRGNQSDLARDSQIETVIVTAQKRAERLLDVPQAVTVLSSDALAKLGASQFRDFADTVPGLSFTTGGTGHTQITLRGTTTGPEITPTVEVFVDEVPYGAGLTQPAQLALDVALFDINRIEVLRGPQGTLYGARSMGGLVKYVTNQPDTTAFGATLQAGISDTRHGDIGYNAALAINAPITDEAAIRASGFYFRDGGYIDNVELDKHDVNRSDLYGGRIDLLLTPNDALTVRIAATLQETSRDGTASADFTTTGEPIEGSLEQRRFLPEPFDQEFGVLAGTISYDFGSATLTSISSYQTVRSEIGYDYTGSFIPFFPDFSAVGYTQLLDGDTVTQELRLASSERTPFEWLVGGFYTDSTEHDDEGYSAFDLTGQPAPDDLYTVSRKASQTEYAAFGNLTYRISNKFDVSGGIRYSSYSRDDSKIESGIFAPAPEPPGSTSDDKLTYLANARYYFGERATGYLRYATGFRPGGPNGFNPVTGERFPPYESDELKSYEVGFRSDSPDGNFSIDVAGFFIDWSNIQTIGITEAGFGIALNSPEATILGAELTLTGRLTPSFTASGAFAYQDATLSEADPAVGGEDGERLPNAPRFTAALHGDYEFSRSDLRPTIGFTVRHASDQTSAFNNSPFFEQRFFDDYTTVNLRTSVLLGATTVQFAVRNLLDERAQLPAVSGTTGLPVIQPRTVLMTVTAHF